MKGVTDPEKKRKIIGNTFIHVFEEEAAKIKPRDGSEIEYLLQGTLYPDVIESISFKGPSQTIKTHHNVGGLLEDMKLKLIEPLRELFKDEVRHLGELLGVPEDLVWRHPFPGPGLPSEFWEKLPKNKLKLLVKPMLSLLKKSRKLAYTDKSHKLLLHCYRSNLLVLWVIKELMNKLLH